MRKDRQDTWTNGILVGLCLPAVMYFVFKGIDTLIPKLVSFMPEGFSEQLIVMLAIFCNMLPFQIFVRQKRDYAMQGVILATFIGVGYYMLKFKFPHLLPNFSAI
jgi:hypothetical protein